jgi:nitric oxide reductase NorQ protein
LKESGLPEGASTRLLIQAAQLFRSGIDIGSSCRAGITCSLTDDSDMLSAMDEMIASIF